MPNKISNLMRSSERGAPICLKPLFAELAEVFSGVQAIEVQARDALRAAVPDVDPPAGAVPLPGPFLEVMAQADAHPICALIARTPFNWAPPQTSNDPLYTEHSRPKVHVELLGPEGLVTSSKVRLGLYGMLPNSEYGVRTHSAEETFIMLAGQAYWKRGAAPYALHQPGERSYHPSMMPHATRTDGAAFMSVYVWHGDISTNNYLYEGLPAE